MVPNSLSYRPNYLHALTISDAMPELLDSLCIAQEHETIFGRCWQLAKGINPDNNVVKNLLGELLTPKG